MYDLGVPRSIQIHQHHDKRSVDRVALPLLECDVDTNEKSVPLQVARLERVARENDKYFGEPLLLLEKEVVDRK